MLYILTVGLSLLHVYDLDVYIFVRKVMITLILWLKHIEVYSHMHSNNTLSLHFNGLNFMPHLTLGIVKCYPLQFWVCSCWILYLEVIHNAVILLVQYIIYDMRSPHLHYQKNLENSLVYDLYSLHKHALSERNTLVQYTCTEVYFKIVWNM